MLQPSCPLIGWFLVLSGGSLVQLSAALQPLLMQISACLATWAGAHTEKVAPGEFGGLGNAAAEGPITHARAALPRAALVIILRR